MYRLLKVLAFNLLLACPTCLFAEDPVFSGPQAGERLPAFRVKGAVGELAGKEYDPVAVSEGKPLLLIFFHEKTRPAFGMCRAIAKYTGSLKESHGLTTHMVLLTDDPSTEENWAKNVVQRNFPDSLEVAISQDGREGPGAYGLNRNVALTILVGNQGKVTANFALVQPQLQADGPPVLKAVAAVTGAREIPSVESLAERYTRDMAAQKRMQDQRGGQAAQRGNADQEGGQQDPSFTGLLRAVINKQATDEEVNQAATKVEEYVATNEVAKRELKRIANTVVNSGKLSNYGTPAAQAVLRKWVKQFENEAGQKLDVPKN